MEVDGRGISSYPHPWLMPEYWQTPTVSMGLGPIAAIYQARNFKYLEGRGLMPKTDRKVWCFLGDGETDEPESLGAISVAGREGLDNLVFADRKSVASGTSVSVRVDRGGSRSIKQKKK